MYPGLDPPHCADHDSVRGFGISWIDHRYRDFNRVAGFVWILLHMLPVERVRAERAEGMV